MKKIIYYCDRCNTEIKDKAKYISIDTLDDDGLIIDEENPLDDCQFCSKCTGEILAFIANCQPKRRGRPRRKAHTAR